MGLGQRKIGIHLDVYIHIVAAPYLVSVDIVSPHLEACSNGADRLGQTLAPLPDGVDVDHDITLLDHVPDPAFHVCRDTMGLLQRHAAGHTHGKIGEGERASLAHSHRADLLHTRHPGGFFGNLVDQTRGRGIQQMTGGLPPQL